MLTGFIFVVCTIKTFTLAILGVDWLFLAEGPTVGYYGCRNVLKNKSKVRGDFWHFFFVKARWEWWCRWNCDLRVINAHKKGIFWHNESVAMTPKSCDHMPTTSLWGVTAKWPTRAPKTRQILCPRDPQGYSRISLSLSGRILKEYWNIVSASTCGIPWGLWNCTHWSARYTNGRDAAEQKSQLVWIV